MSRYGSLLRLVGPVAALYLMGCGGAQADLVAPNEQLTPATGCTSGAGGTRASRKCGEVTLTEHGKAVTPNV